MATKKTARNTIRVVSGRLADVSPPAKCIHASQGNAVPSVMEQAIRAFSNLVNYIIAEFVYRRKCLNTNKSKYVYVYRQTRLFLLY